MIEEELTGGNTSHVVRVGDTVRRTAGPWTPAVHDLLDHLAAVGFGGAPRALGFDAAGREVLAYVPGEVGTLDADAPLSPWFRTSEACWTIGRWIRDFQTAQVGFAPDPARPWRRSAGERLAPGRVLVHHDVSPYNTVRRADGTIVVIDWDFVRPGDPLDDLAWAAWMWAPLRAGTWWHAEYGLGAGDDVERHQRENLAALVDGYGPSQEQQARLPVAVRHQMLHHAADLDDLARTDPAFADLVARGFAARARADAAWWDTWRKVLGRSDPCS